MDNLRKQQSLPSFAAIKKDSSGGGGGGQDKGGQVVLLNPFFKNGYTFGASDPLCRHPLIRLYPSFLPLSLLAGRY
ncbi:hypothetical protein DFA_06520 [Cavenderia fasciculata]|uniref:Uncharacterized protein n=1 Tax=Cavenderia fasciculata TaxID=261658 RepID=F4PJ84_CACFS|nr:uncharacterized protein DFA_06520 [Cavenderia fasciculata]EGG24370.1 hypothetical protein DFA_06520 [Cavenderia fasciculata]|eukprot:XP_004362221.1 hypothetical protein DFA_06520 [Cavenderia fasciculata]